MTEFTPGSALAGGLLRGMSASLLLILNARIAGISGIVGGLFQCDFGTSFFAVSAISAATTASSDALSGSLIGRWWVCSF